MGDNIIILDGAMGTALRARGVKVPNYKSSIWSALAVVDAPEAIELLHADYIRAGAQVITANNYALTIPMLTHENMQDRQSEMIIKSVDLALTARAEVGDMGVKVAGSLPPLHTSYRYDLVEPFDDCLRQYRNIVTAASGADMFICETITTIDEARAAATAGLESGKPVWVSWTLSPATANLRGGATIKEAYAALEGLSIDGFLFNCAACEPVSKALPKLRALTDKPIGAYCNPVMSEPVEGFEPEAVPTLPMTAAQYAVVAKGWLDIGATLLGGCCDTDPSYIKELSRLKD